MGGLVPAMVMLAATLAACSSGDYGSAPVASAAPAPVVATAPSAPPTTVTRTDLAPPAAHTASDGYPNINVDTAAPSRAPVRSAAERDKLEAELMALGERQRSTVGGAPQSVIQEMQDLGRRSRADALKQIESGKAPD